MVRRSSSNAAKHRARIARAKPACAICGGVIDYSLPWQDPKAFVVDHIIPLAKGGEDAPHNVQAAHRHMRLQLKKEGANRGPDREAKRKPPIDLPL